MKINVQLLCGVNNCDCGDISIASIYIARESGFLLGDFLVDHGSEVGEDLVLSFGPLLTVEHGQCSPEGGIVILHFRVTGWLG